jgi:hypothetical protein
VHVYQPLREAYLDRIPMGASGLAYSLLIRSGLHMRLAGLGDMARSAPSKRLRGHGSEK